MSQSETPINAFMWATDITCPDPQATACCRCCKLLARFLSDIANSLKTAPAGLDCASNASVSDDRALRLPGESNADDPAEALEAFERLCDPRKTGVS